MGAGLQDNDRLLLNDLLQKHLVDLVHLVELVDPENAWSDNTITPASSYR